MATFVEGDWCECCCYKCCFCYADDDCKMVCEEGDRCCDGCGGWFVVEDVIVNGVKEGLTVSEPRWSGKLTGEEMARRLGIAACALDKIAEWTSRDDDEFGNVKAFAANALDITYSGDLRPLGTDKLKRK